MDKNNTLADDKGEKDNIIKIAPYIISILAFLFSIYTYYTTLPLQQANVIFSASDITITPNVIIPGTDLTGDWIIPSISNIGKSSAENIKFTIYIVQSTSSVQQIFNDSLVTNLEPGEKVRFGAFGPTYKAPSGIDMSGARVGIIFHLSYIDSLTKEQKNSVSMYTYSLGGKDTITNLVNSNYKDIYKSLLESATTTENDYLYKYLRDNKPNY